LLVCALVGAAIGGTAGWLVTRHAPITTSARLVLSFPGFERGEYPDHSLFQPGDLIAGAVVDDALARFNSGRMSPPKRMIERGLYVEGVVPQATVATRDRMRATGQLRGAFVPDEYVVRLSLPATDALSLSDRERILAEIVASYRARFERTYGGMPKNLGHVFAALRQSDYPDFETVFATEIAELTSFLTDRLDEAGTFRSPTTHLTFQDLLDQTNLFAGLHLNETLALIGENGMSRDRAAALAKMDYAVDSLTDLANSARAESEVVNGLLTGSNAPSYLVALKQNAVEDRPQAPLVDAGLVDSLLANDARNFLVRAALKAGTEFKEIQAREEQAKERRDKLRQFIGHGSDVQTAIIAEVGRSLDGLQNAYDQLFASIRATCADFARERYAGAIRIIQSPRTEAGILPLVVAGGVGGFLGLALGLGLALLGIRIGPAAHPNAAPPG